MILDIGCGWYKTPGATGPDINPATQADVPADAGRHPVPFPATCLEVVK